MSSFEQAKRIVRNRASCLDVARMMNLPVNRFGRMDYCPICGYKANHKGSGGFVIYQDDHFYCNYSHHGGDTITFVMDAMGFSFYEAVQWIDESFGLNLQLSKPTDSELKRFSKEQQTRNAWYVLYELAVNLYAKLAEAGIVEPIQQANILLDDVKAMIDKLI